MTDTIGITRQTFKIVKLNRFSIVRFSFWSPMIPLFKFRMRDFFIGFTELEIAFMLKGLLDYNLAVPTINISSASKSL